MSESVPRWVTHMSLDGPGFVKWLREGCGVTSFDARFGKNHKICRAMRRAAYEGSSTTVALADEICVELGRHIWEIPDGLWIKGDTRGRPPWPDEVRQRALAAYEQGDSVREIRERLGVSGDTLRKWKAREKAAA